MPPAVGDARDGRRACPVAPGLEGCRRDRPGHRAGQRPAARRRSSRSCASWRDATAAATPQRSAALTALAAIDPAGNEALLKDVLRDASAPMGLRESAAGSAGGERSPGVAGHPDRRDAGGAGPVAVGDRGGAGPTPRRRRGAAGRDRRGQGLGAAAPGAAGGRRAQAGETAAAGGAAQDAAGRAAPGRPEARRAPGPSPGRVPGVVADSIGPRRAPRSSRRTAAICHQLGGKGGEGRAAARRHRQPRPRPPLRGHPRPEPQRRPGVPHHRARDWRTARSSRACCSARRGKSSSSPTRRARRCASRRSSVVERKTSPLSPMPANFADQISAGGLQPPARLPALEARAIRPAAGVEVKQGRLVPAFPAMTASA